MNANSLKFIRSAGSVAGAMLALSGVSLLGGEKATDAFPNYDSYIKVTGQAASVSGDGAAYQGRARQPENGAYGIEDFFFTKETGKDLTMTINGRALAGAEDYLGSVKWTKNEVGTLEIGYKKFRTWYDGVGGFFSNNPVNFYGSSASYYGSAPTYTINGKSYTPTATYVPIQALAKEALALDRSKFWVEATIAEPEKPVFSFKYTNELRNGKKDSTIWGQTDFTGLPTNGYLLNPISPTRAILPSYINVGERNENYEFSVKHSVKNVTASLTLFAERTDNLDTRYVTRYPGEVKIFAVPASTLTGKLVSSVNTNNQIVEQQTDGSSVKTRGVHGKVDVALTDTLTLKLAGAYEDVSNDFSGDRPLVTYTPTSKTVIPATPYDASVAAVATDINQSLYGTANLQELTGSVALEWKPVPAALVKVGLKAEKEWFNADGGYTRISSAQNATTGAITYTTVSYKNFARLTQDGTIPVGEFRYTGIKDVALYATASASDISGNERNYASLNLSTQVVSNPLVQTPSEKHGEYTAGANWRVNNLLTLRGEVYDKNHKDSFVGTYNGAYNYYQLELEYTGYKLTAIVKPFAALTSTTRFVSQHGKGKTAGSAVNVVSSTMDSLSSDSYQLGETIDLSTGKSWYVQVAANLVYNEISTIYPRAGTYPANTTANPPVGAYDVNRVIQNAKGNYYTVSALAGFAVADHTDLQLQYVGYRANNGNANLGLYSVAYGVDCSDSTTTVGIKHKFSDKLVMNAKVGYIDSRNDTTGGYTNYRGPMAYVTFEHAL